MRRAAITNVGKSGREGTFAGASANDEVAPFAATHFFACASTA